MGACSEGPWEWGGEAGVPTYLKGGDGSVIAVVDFYQPNVMGNSNVMKLAPDMLDMLKSLDVEIRGNNWENESRYWLPLLESLILKVEGRDVAAAQT